MIERTLKTIGGKLRVAIPTQLDEITLGQMMDLQEKTDAQDIEAISILANIPANDLKNVVNYDDFHELGEAILSLAGQIRYLYHLDTVPKEVVFKLPGNANAARKIKVMQSLSVEPVGAFMAARDIIAEEINDFIKKHGEDSWQDHFNPSLKACCQVLAQYFYCRTTGKPYNEYEVDEFINQVKQMRVTEAMPIAKHFFHCYPNLSKPKTSFWHRLLPRSKKGQASRPSKNLNISIP
ncbi:hypothetical protein [Mucilaginibacter celer]|uniref:Uncharacterized protein n=1 Tax=Mucilaginibacter celer TaxID=2305508 RepID=A0A494VYK6_9SPHI|nr:hypothetical protein [Mucilaginibacter celer]AYL96408.1 hypothetical protein HYN43_014365 [Mucilaginibacter celer]